MHNDMPVSKVMSFLSTSESNYFKFFLLWDPTGKIILLLSSYFLTLDSIFLLDFPNQSNHGAVFSSQICSAVTCGVH